MEAVRGEPQGGGSESGGDPVQGGQTSPCETEALSAAGQESRFQTRAGDTRRKPWLLRHEERCQHAGWKKTTGKEVEEKKGQEAGLEG